MVRNPKLCKSLEVLVDKFRRVDGRTRILKVVYLADKAWFEEHGETYTEARWYRWNHGPYAREVLQALSWMDGVEIVETETPLSGGTNYWYAPGETTRLASVRLDGDFLQLLLNTGRRWMDKSLNSLLKHVYADETFDATKFGDRLLKPTHAAVSRG